MGRWLKSAIGITLAGHVRAELADLLVGKLQEVVEGAQLVHQLERRGMDGVPAEVAEEVRVLLQHEHVDARAREQVTQHHPRRTAPRDAAAHRDLVRHEPFRRAAAAIESVP